MAIAQLSIDLIAKLASFEADLKKAVASARQGSEDIANAFGLAKAAVGGLVGALSVQALVGFVRNTAAGVDKLNDLADATGSSVENLSALEDVAARTGTSMDTVGAALIKLNKTLGDALPATDQARAIQALGLSVNELKQLDPAEALLKVAQSLQRFQDDGNKARIVQELFGKSIREVAPLLNDLAAKGQLNATITAEQAAKFEAFNHQLDNLRKNSEDAGRRLVGDLLPALNAVLDAFNKKGVGAAAREFGDQVGEAIGLGKEYHAERNLKILAQDVALLQLQLATAPPGPAGRSLKAELDAKTADYEKAREAYLKVRKLDAASMDAAENYGNEGRRRPLAKLGDFKVDPEVTKAATEYAKLAASIGLANDGLAQEIATGDKLTPGQQFRARILAVLEGAEYKFSQAQRDSIRSALQANATLEDDARLRELSAKVRQFSLTLAERELQAVDREAAARLQSNEQLRQEAEEYGKSTAAIERMRIARLEEAAAQEDLAILGLRNIEGTENETAARQRNADALRDQIRLRRQLLGQNEKLATDPTTGAQRALDDYLLKLNDAGTATREAVGRGLDTLESELTDSLRQGRFSVRKFVDDVIQEMIRLQIVRPLLKSIFGGAGSDQGGSLAGLLKGLFGGSSGGGGLNYGGQFDGFRASGGTVPPGKWVIAGERGPEPVYGGMNGATVLPNKALQASAPAYTINVQGDASENTLRLIQTALAQFQAQQMRRA